MADPGERFWLNGAFTDEQNARIPVLDRGVLFGDALYETVRYYGNRPFLTDRHFDRLFQNAEALRFPVRYDRAELQAVVTGLIERGSHKDGLIYLQWTRGAAPRGLVPGLGLLPNVFAFRSRLTTVPRRFRKEGAPVITLPDLRWHRTEIKTTNLMGSVLSRQEAAAENAYEALLYRGSGKRARMTEGTSTSLFLAIDGRLVTPRVRELLPGITREVVLELGRESGMVVEERRVSREELFLADEIFLTATSIEILPVSSIDGRRPRVEPPGPVTGSLSDDFAKFRRNSLAAD